MLEKRKELNRLQDIKMKIQVIFWLTYTHIKIIKLTYLLLPFYIFDLNRPKAIYYIKNF